MDRLISIVGGSGFIGRTLVEHLARQGWRIRVACRSASRGARLKPLGDVGQIGVVETDVRAPGTLGPVVEGAYAVINLVGILDEKGGQGFNDVHVKGAGNVAAACAALGVERLVHVSAIGADVASESAYGQSKGRGEAAVRAAFPAATIVRPSLVFGPDDSFTNRFAAMMVKAPVVPVVAAQMRMQPLYVADVAQALIAAINRPGETFEIGGPQVLTMQQIMEMIAEAAGQKKPVLEVPSAGAQMLANLDFLPGAPITRDQYRMLQYDNLVSADAAGLEALGVQPTPMGAVIGEWLSRHRPGGRFAAMRS